MQRDELDFKIQMEAEEKELQKAVNKLLLNFEQKHYFLTVLD